jgi:hypothetical protein
MAYLLELLQTKLGSVPSKTHHPKPALAPQMGIKITNEAPVGIKAGLRASYQWVNQDMLDAVGRPEWRQLLFISCFLHSVVQVGGAATRGMLGFGLLLSCCQNTPCTRL